MNQKFERVESDSIIESSDQETLSLEDRNLLLLMSSGELDTEATQKAKRLLDASPLAKEYFNDLIELNLLASELQIDSTSVDTNCEFSFVAKALQVENDREVDLRVAQRNGGSPCRRHTLIINHSLMFYAAASVAIVLGSISIFKIIESNQDLNTSSGLADATRSDSTRAKSNSSQSTRSISNSGTGSSSPLPNKKKRKKIRIKSDLLAKIQNTRSKIKSFRKRLEKRS